MESADSKKIMRNSNPFSPNLKNTSLLVSTSPKQGQVPVHFHSPDRELESEAAVGVNYVNLAFRKRYTKSDLWIGSFFTQHTKGALTTYTI